MTIGQAVETSHDEDDVVYVSHAVGAIERWAALNGYETQCKDVGPYYHVWGYRPGVEVSEFAAEWTLKTLSR